MLVDLPLVWVLVLDIVAWFALHMGISLLLMKVPDAWYAQAEGIFKMRAWEREGQFWAELFHIREWKHHLPDGSRIVKTAYDKTRLRGTDTESLQKFIVETKRAELTHWLLILPVPFFFIWNPAWAGVVNVLYALVANVPFILSQRFNRPRLERLYRMKLKREEG